MSELKHNLDFQADGAVPLRTVVLEPGQDILPFDGEPVKPFMKWGEWDIGFSGINIEGLTYSGCRLLAHRYKYAFRGNREIPRDSRSQSVITEWDVTDPAVAPPGYESFDVSRLTVLFPIYDGVGFLIGKRRRMTGEVHYSPEEERAIALASAIGAIGTGHEVTFLQGPGHLVYRCVWMPGKALDDGGKIIPSSSNIAFDSLGLSVAELDPIDDSGVPQRLFGDARWMCRHNSRLRAPFSTLLAEQLRPARDYVNRLPGNNQEPSLDTY
jgi:hypothetical protein